MWMIHRAGYRCQRCGGAGRLELHHRHHVADGGVDDPANLEVLCRRCHPSEHSSRDPARREWKELIDGVS